MRARQRRATARECAVRERKSRVRGVSGHGAVLAWVVVVAVVVVGSSATATGAVSVESASPKTSARASLGLLMQ
jgi:hypothetical protein